MTNAAQVLGPLGAGLVLLARPASRVAYAVDALLFTVALWAALRLPPLPPAERDAGAPATAGSRDLVDGLRYLRTQPVLLLSFAIDIVAMVLAMPRALFPEVAAERFGGGAAVGWLFSAIAIGSVVGRADLGLDRPGAPAGRRARRSRSSAGGWRSAPPGWRPRCGWRCCCSRWPAPPTWSARCTGRRSCSTYAPDEMRGRMQGVFMVVVAGGPRLGDLRAGAMAAVDRRDRGLGRRRDRRGRGRGAARRGVPGAAALHPRRPRSSAVGSPCHGRRRRQPTPSLVRYSSGPSPPAATRPSWSRSAGGCGPTGAGGVDSSTGTARTRSAPARAGQVLAPWPNRIRDGRYTFDGEAHQLALTEPARHNAIHGLVNWARWHAGRASAGRR